MSAEELAPLRFVYCHAHRVREVENRGDTRIGPNRLDAYFYQAALFLWGDGVAQEDATALWTARAAKP